MATVKGKWVFNEVLVPPEYDKDSITDFAQKLTEEPVGFTSTDGSGEPRLYAGMAWWVFSDSIDYPKLSYVTELGDSYSYVYDYGLWRDYGDFRTVDFGETEQEVSGEFYAWFTANAIPVDAAIVNYNGAITYFEAGQTATLACAGKRMLSDVAVVFGAAGVVHYNGAETAVGEGQTATLLCNGKRMLTDVVIYFGTPAKGVRLLTSDGYAVTDLNGIYVTTKEES